jgi:hypothetical protein
MRNVHPRTRECMKHMLTLRCATESDFLQTNLCVCVCVCVFNGESWGAFHKKFLVDYCVDERANEQTSAGDSFPVSACLSKASC